MALNKIVLSDGVTELANVKSVVFHEAVNADEDLRPGCVGSASIEVDVFNSQANAVAAGDVVYCYQIDKNDVETLLGQFVCEPKIDTKNSYSFTAYDNAQKLNADFSQWLRENQSAFPLTVYQLVSNACAVAGVTLGSSSWGLSTQSVGAFYADGITCRDILSYAAEIGCCFVRCHTDGNIYFNWYSANAKTIGPTIGTNRYAYKQDGLTYANYTTTALARVAVHPSGEDDMAYIYPTGVTSGNTMHIKNNLLLTGADASFYNAVAQQVYTVMSSLGTYRPMTANLFAKENPFRAGDIVSVTDSQGVTFNSVVMDMSVSPSGAVLTSTGREVYGEYALDTARKLVQLAADIVRINKLKVDWAEIETAIIDTLEANGINADWINAGTLKVEDAYGNVVFEADIDTHIAQVGGFAASIFGILTNEFADANGRKVFQICSDQSSSMGHDYYNVYCYDANNNLVSYWQLADYISISSLQQYSGVELIYANVSVASSSVCLTNNGIYFCTQGDWKVHFATDGSIEFKNATIKQNWITELGVVDLSTAQTVGGTKTFTSTDGVHSRGSYVSNTTYAENKYSSQFVLDDSAGTNIGMVRTTHYSNGIEQTEMFARRKVNGTDVYNSIGLRIASNGARTVSVSDAAIWRSALGLGSVATQSTVAIANGGTGSTGVLGLSGIVTAGSNFQVTSQTAAQWGPIVQLDVAVKCTTAVTVTTGTTVFTVATGYRTALDINFIDSAGARALWRTNGNVTSFKTIAKDATLSFRAVYLTWGT